MKRILSILCVLAMLFTMCSCATGVVYESYYEQGGPNTSANSSANNSQPSSNTGTNSSDAQNSNAGSSATQTGSNSTAASKDCKHSYDAATCTKASVCKLCGTTVAKALGHKYVSGKCQRCGAKDSSLTNWYTEGEIKMSKSEVQQVLSINYSKPKNVIMMICDGMGPNDIILAEKHSKNLNDYGTILNQIKYNGFCTTNNVAGTTTDSAAAGTALSTGNKTSNKHLGQDKDGKIFKNISEIAREKGKVIGIVTDDDITGATPAAFIAHTSSRQNFEDIANAYVKFKPDVLIGQGYNGDFKFSSMNLSNFLVATDFSKFNEKLNEDNFRLKSFFGFFKQGVLEPSNTLAYCTEIALNRLKNKGSGFFLMVESTAGDTWGHKNNINGKINNVVTVDRTVATILKFMKENPDTLLLITSDHETGGVTIPSGNYTLDASLFTSNEHTSTIVRTFAVGYGANKIHNKTIDNTDFAKIAIEAISN